MFYEFFLKKISVFWTPVGLELYYISLETGLDWI